ncbi:MAG: M28 family metallopeptidase [Promethearchaeota archaeon]
MINKKRIEHNLNSFSFPRVSGSSGERKALELVKEKIEALNLHPEIQEFEFSTFYSRIYPKLGFFSISILLLIYYLNIEALIFVIIVSFLLIIMMFSFILTRKPHEIKFGKKLKSHNLYVILPPKNKLINLNQEDNQTFSKERTESPINVLFFCHLDSKGQKFSILTRIIAIRTWIYTAVLLSIIILLKNYILPQYEKLFYFLGIVPLSINFIAMTILILNTTNDNSRGAIDNASGISIVLELLNYYAEQENRFKKYWFVFTGAEETGTMGIRMFYEEINHLDKKRTIILNFDAIGQSVCLFASKETRKLKPEFFNLLIIKGREFNILKDIRYKTLGAHSDGYFLKKQGFRGAGFGDLRTYRYVHSREDTPDKINVSILEKLCKLIIFTFKRLEDI